jgi:hypothetical protein
LDVFDPGDGDPESALLAAGALMMAATIVIDELFQDVRLLGRDTVADSDEVFMVLELPERFARHYDGRFARNFLIAMIMVTGRLAEVEWTSPASVDEALALHVVVKRARVLLDMHELFDEQTLRRLYHGFDDAAYDDVDHEWLYQRDMDGFEDDPGFATQFGVTATQSAPGSITSRTRVAMSIRSPSKWTGPRPATTRRKADSTRTAMVPNAGTHPVLGTVYW